MARRAIDEAVREAALAALFDGALTVAEIARAAGVSHVTIQGYARAAGLDAKRARETTVQQKWAEYAAKARGWVEQLHADQELRKPRLVRENVPRAGYMVEQSRRETPEEVEARIAAAQTPSQPPAAPQAPAPRAPHVPSEEEKAYIAGVVAATRARHGLPPLGNTLADSIANFLKNNP